MRIIKKLAEQINDEVDGAIDYAMFTLGINASATVSNFVTKAKKTD
jgi:hypothetical protein